ncbi:MAG: Asp23/Gls24 family envelope stress response protein [Firmicutes bacterium]|nr:Asp23/Gls24 family envelope stress response protein [Bacillota bacterium]
MKVIAFVGASGTGKSYRSITVASEHGADGIIDDGLLISNGKVVAGTSAKSEPTMMASVKHAMFMKDEQAADIKKYLKSGKIRCLMILGTSDNMVQKIAKALDAGEIEEYIHIEDVASEEEMRLAHNMRMNEGKHVIPVPTFEIKKEFSGYFLHPLRRFQKNLDTEIDTAAADKSIVRPTFSYMGDYVISDRVIAAMAIYEAEKIDGLVKVLNINVRKTAHGAHLDMTASVKFGYNIQSVCKQVQNVVKDNIENYTSVNVRRVHVLVKTLVM